MKLKIGAKLGVGWNYSHSDRRKQRSQLCAPVAIEQKSVTSRKFAFPPSKPRDTAGSARYTGSKARHAILAGTDATRRAKAQQAFDSGWSAIDQQLTRLNELSPRWTNQANKDHLAKIKEDLPKVRKMQQATMDAAAGNSRDASRKRDEKGHPFPRRNRQVSQ